MLSWEYAQFEYYYIYVHTGKTKREAKEEKGSREHGRRGIAVNIV